MPSYKIVPLPKPGIKRNTEFMKNIINKFPAKESAASFKFGTIPESFTEVDGTIFFYYVIEYEMEYESLVGVKKVEPSPIEKIPVIFLKDYMLAIGHCKKEFEEKVLDFIETNFISGYLLQNIEFEEETLRAIIEKHPEVLQLDLTPVYGRIDKISCTGRGITESELWRDYGDQPLISVKVRLVGIPEEANVGFRKKGIITIFNRNFSIKQQIMVLKHVIDLISPYLKPIFQTKLR